MKQFFTMLVVCLWLAPAISNAQEITAFRFSLNNPDNVIQTTEFAATAVYDAPVVLNIGDIPKGHHRLYIEVRDTQGNWSHYTVRNFLVEGGLGMHLLSSAEYFFDSDPGTGNGYALLIPQETSVSDSFAIPLPEDLTPGTHRMYIRVKDQAGQWSQLVMRTILAEGSLSMNLVYGGEYFFDTDPGIGNGFPILFDAAASIEENVNLDIPADMPLGPHRLYVRVRDNDGLWSFYHSQTIQVCETYAPLASFTSSVIQGGWYQEFISTSELAGEVSWTVNNQNAGSASELLYEFGVIGNYDVCLTATNGCGTDQYCELVQVLGITDVYGQAAISGTSSTHTIRGAFVPGGEARLVAEGLDPIVAISTEYVAPDRLLGLFNYTGATAGWRNLEVIYPGDDTLRYINAIEVVETGSTAEINLLIQGRARMLAGSSEPYTIQTENWGDEDAIGVPLLLREIPQGYTFGLSEATQVADLAEIPLFGSLISFVQSEGLDPMIISPWMMDEVANQTGFGLIIPRIPNGGEVFPQYWVTVPGGGMRMNARTSNRPWLSSASLGGDIVQNPNCNEDAFRSVLEEVLGTDVPASFSTCYSAAYGDVLTWIRDEAQTSLAGQRLLPFQAASAYLFFETMECAGAPLTGQQLRDCVLLLNAGSHFLPVELEYCESAYTYNAPLADAGDHLMQPDDRSGTCEGNFNNGAFMGGLNPANQDAFKNLCTIITSDPNTKEGPLVDLAWLNSARMIPYQIWFENMDTATASVSYIRLSDTLDTQVFDLSTFELTAFGLQQQVFAVPDGRTTHSEILDFTGQFGVLVHYRAELDLSTGILEATFTSLDPETLLPETDPDLGFLPPNVTNPEGVGWISFRCGLRDDLSNGDLIRNRAHIFFDFNAPVITEYWNLQYDEELPVSTITNGPTADPSFTLTWDESDNYSGIDHVEIYRTDGPVDLLLASVPPAQGSLAVSAEAGTTAEFMTIAYDRAGNVQGTPSVLSIDIIDSVEELSADWTVYPNPCNTWIEVISGPWNAGQRWKLTDGCGRAVREGMLQQSRQRLDLTGIAPGVYHLHIHEFGVQSIVIQH